LFLSFRQSIFEQLIRAILISQTGSSNCFQAPVFEQPFSSNSFSKTLFRETVFRETVFQQTDLFHHNFVGVKKTDKRLAATNSNIR
jgi:hypothetical protein